MIYKNKNFSRDKINNYSFSNDDEFIMCNFSQSVPHTSILTGLTNIKLTKCNLVNCDIPVDAIKTDCLHIQKSICSHLHTNRLAKGEIPECPPNCEHVIDTDEVIIDDIPIGISYHYQDTVVE